MSNKKDKAEVFVDKNGVKLHGYTSLPVANEIKQDAEIIGNKDADPLTKDLCSPEAIDIALKSLEDD